MTIAYGHPIDMTGAVLTTRALHAIARDGIRRGLVTLCTSAWYCLSNEPEVPQDKQAATASRGIS
ncbi:hypothetical protein [Sphingobium sp. Sx8-8]|uniref:hypothetical protein n=1 Tax=Sphingobium sp. Sx8-8 TaxID=2933617 RepID=UPI00247A8DE0|nr:hypothetical protein [Sphingobium sp. Sx8-8]